MHILSRKYQVSEAGICWKELSNNLNTAKDIYCYTKDETDESVFAVKVRIPLRLSFPQLTFFFFSGVMHKEEYSAD